MLSSSGWWKPSLERINDSAVHNDRESCFRCRRIVSGPMVQDSLIIHVGSKAMVNSNTITKSLCRILEMLMLGLQLA
jgi:hypothetical protein